jgi:hypothetical protein
VAGEAFFGGARWLLRRLLLALVVALVLVVVSRQFTDGGDGDGVAAPSPAVTAPRVGQDHWHATYEVFICGQRQPSFAHWLGGVHTHDDDIIHIHPLIPSEEGAGARLVKWFEYGGGKLTRTQMRMPGSRETFKNGDECPDSTEGVLQIYVNGEWMDDWSRYIPQDGDRIRIAFGPEEAD